MVVIPSTSVAVTGPGAVTDLAPVTDQTDPGLAIVQIDLAQVVVTDLGLEIVQAPDLGAVTGPVPEPDQVHDQAQVQDRVQEQGQVHDQAQVQDRVREQDQVHARVRDKGLVQWIDQGQDQVRDKAVPEPAAEVHLVVTRVGALLPGTVNAGDLVVPVNQDQEVHRAGVGVEADQRAGVVDVAEVAVAAVAVADVDADLKWP